MSGGKMPTCPASASKGFSSTPVKAHPAQDYLRSKGLEDDVLSDEEDTFSLLSPIYHDSFDSDEEPEQSPALQTSPKQDDDSRLSVSPVRWELPRTPSEQISKAAAGPAGSPTLSAWEMWLVNKAKEERLKLEKKAEEEQLLKENQERQQSEQEQKRMVIEGKIQEWLKMKREQEKNGQLLKRCKEEEEIQRQQEKQRETEEKAEQKYKDWLQKKNQRKKEMEKKAKEEAAMKEEQERERRRKAEEKFQEWLKKANEKSKASPKSPCFKSGPYEKFLPSPGFYNPIPWKPIPIPPPETSLNKAVDKKGVKQGKCQERLRPPLRQCTSMSGAQLQQRR